MKTIEIIFKNEDTIFSREIKTTAKDMDKSKIFGTVLSDFFRLIDLQSKGAVKLFNMSSPFDMVVKCDNVVIDTTKIKSELKTKFKLNKSPKRKKAFAQTVYAVLDYATTKTKVTTVEKVIDKLETSIVNDMVETA